MNKKFVSITTAMILLFSITSCGKKEKTQQEVSTRVNVEVFSARKDNISQIVKYTGEIKAGSRAEKDKDNTLGTKTEKDNDSSPETKAEEDKDKQPENMD